MKTVTAEIEVEVPAEVVYDAVLESFKDPRFRSLYKKKMGWDLDNEIMEDRSNGIIGLVAAGRLFPFRKRVGEIHYYIAVSKKNAETSIIGVRISWGVWLDWLGGSSAVRCQAINCALDQLQACISMEVAYKAARQ
jgi:hypothetical protein